MITSVYEKSNSITEVALKRFRATEANDFLAAELFSDREKRAQKLVNYLCDKFGIPSCNVIVSNKPQPHSTRNGKLRSKTYGMYCPNMRYIRLERKIGLTKSHLYERQRN